ncbi:oligosaccharide flippase family protein [Demequina sp. NBRC 110056]|uniref:oligosaccharide flippase family protein n=1 Tax=Demequina sp. NBRC 110056 TaxID=1570345 RepID=UPI0009FC6BDA|nr:oligosaccharide flippase family protein [Demequina sp. NBRC 110056]
MSLRSAALSGGRATYVGQGIKLLLQLVSVAVLARLLTPEDFGIAAMAAVVGGVTGVIATAGIPQALVQTGSLTQARLSRAFWFSALVGAAASALVFLGASTLASLMGESALLVAFRFLSVGYFCSAIAAVFVAKLTRDLSFRRIVLAESLAHAGAILAAVWGALEGLGFWALILQQLVQPLLLVALAGPLSGWRPSSPFRRADISDLLSFGVGSLGAQLVTYLGSAAPVFFLSRAASTYEVGIYNRAQTVTQLPVQQIGPPITRVAFPILSQLRTTQSYIPYLLHGTAAVAYSLGTAMVLISAMSTHVVAVYLGSDWSDASPIVAILGLGLIAQAVGTSQSWVFSSLGMTGVQFRYALLSRAIAVTVVAATAASGGVIVAAATAGGMLLHYLIMSFVAMRRLELDARPLHLLQVRVLLIMFATWPIVHMCAGIAYRLGGDWIALAGGSVAFSLSLAALVGASRTVREDMRGVVSLMRDSLAGPRRARSQ